MLARRWFEGAKHPHQSGRSRVACALQIIVHYTHFTPMAGVDATAGLFNRQAQHPPDVKMPLCVEGHQTLQ